MDNDMRSHHQPKSQTNDYMDHRTGPEYRSMQNQGRYSSYRKYMSTNPVLAILIIVILLFLAGLGGYMLRDSMAKDVERQKNNQIANDQKTINSLQSQINIESSPVLDISSPCSPAVRPTETIISNIESAITSGNTAALASYMTSTVNVVMTDSSAGGMQTPTEAVATISNFITNDNKSWAYNFALPNGTLNAYSQGVNSQYFPDTALIGRAPNDKVISFLFDCNGNISSVFMSDTESDNNNSNTNSPRY